MRFTAAPQHRKQVTKFVSICRIRSALVVSATDAAAKPPAMWIDAHRRGTASNTRATAASSERSPPAISSTSTWSQAKRSASLSTRWHVAAGAALDQLSHHRGAEGAGAAGDE